MKCPQCGRWNRESLPRCFYCGADLTANAGRRMSPDQQRPAEDAVPEKTYIQYTEQGRSTPEVDERDQLAAEMKDLLARKRRGERLHRRLRENSAQQGFAPTGRTAQNITGRRAYTDPEEAWQEGDGVIGGIVRDDAIPVQARQVIGYDQDPRVHSGVVPAADDPSGRMWKRYKMVRHPWLRWVALSLLLLAALGGAALAGYHYLYLPMQEKAEKDALARQAIITPSIFNDRAAHIIRIPGEEGQTYWIGGKIKHEYMVVDGYATFEVLDYIWYEDMESITVDTVTATIIPYLHTYAGEQKQLEPITYEVTIPESRLELVSPSTAEQVKVYTLLYTIEFIVDNGSTVYINDEERSDLVSIDSRATSQGRITYQAPIEAIGENVFTIRVRAPYCRETTKQIVIFRERQQIPLDLAADINNRYTPSWVEDTSQPRNEKGEYPKVEPKMLVRGTTVTWATIQVLTPYVELDLTNLPVDGSFSFRAVFDKIGYNTIIIEASAEGCETSRVEHEVYYMPVADIYTRKAWDMNQNYTDYLNHIETRVANTQIYQCIGEITEIVSSNPQWAIMKLDSGADRTVMLSNYTYDTWIVGQRYKIFGDAYGKYNDSPWLNGRYSYLLN